MKNFDNYNKLDGIIETDETFLNKAKKEIQTSST